MNKSIVAAIVAAVIVIAGGGAYLATRSSDNSNTTSKPPANTATQNTDMNGMKNMGSSAKSDNAGPAATNNVTIENFAFNPANITIKKGTTVTWVNKDSAAHTVTENDGQTGPDSGSLANGASYSFTYKTAGTFKYHCAFHPNMLGTVTVTE